MRSRRAAFTLLLVLAGLSCTRDPNVAKRKYLDNGNRYFDQSKYKEAAIMYRNALKKDPLYGEAYYRLGLTDLKMERPADAIRNFRKAVDVQRSHIEAKKSLADLLIVFYAANPQRNEALLKEMEQLAANLLKDPRSVPGLRLKGYLALLRNRDSKAALEAFQQADSISPNRPEVVLPLAQTLIQNGRFPEAEKLARALVEKEKSFGEIYDLLYVQYAKSNRIAEAENILKLKIANNPKKPDYLVQLALHYYAMKRRPEMQGAIERLVALRSEVPDARLRAGNFYLAVREFDSAVNQYEAGAREDSRRKADYEKKKAEVLLAQGRREEAQRLVEQIVREHPKDQGAKGMLASMRIESGNPDQLRAAISDLQGVVSQEPANAVYRFNLGRALLASRQVEQAKLQLQEAVKLQEAYIPPRLLLAQLHLYRGEFGDALQQARRIVALDPRNLPAKLVRSTALASMGNREQARSDLQETLKEHPNSTEAVVQLAVLDLGEKRFRDAEAKFSKLHENRPTDLRGLMGLSETYAAQGQYAKAIELLQRELSRAPDRPRIRLALGNIAYRAGNYNLAAEQFETLVKQQPKSGDAYLRLGDTYRQKGDFAGAVRSFQKARELRPDDPVAHLRLALMLDATGKKAEARPMYEQVLKFQPDNAVALNNLAYMIAESGGDLDHALTLAQRAKQKWPKDPSVADTLGWIYIKKNLSENAIRIFSDLVVQEPDVSTYRYHLAMALFQKGDKAGARQQLQAALQKKPSSDEAAKIKDLLSRLG